MRGTTLSSWHEARLIWSADARLGLLTSLAPFAPPIVRLGRLGWVVRDPELIREVLNAHRSVSLLGEGGVGHLWAQLLGDWVNDTFDGAGHHALRTRARDLFTKARAAALVSSVATPMLGEVTQRLRAGGEVDVADTARVLVGRMIAAMLGLDVEPFRRDAAALGLDHDGAGPYRLVFRRGEELAGIAVGTTADTHLSATAVQRGRAIIAELTAGVPDNFRTAGPDTILGRCRELGLTETEALGLASLLLVAGTETAASAISRTTAILADTGQVGRLHAARGTDRDALLDTAVREGLRVTTPAPIIGRAVTGDLTVAGRRLRAGDRIVALTYVANRGRGGFDLDRPYLPENKQLWFGAGRHLCLGSAVAQAELRHVLEALLAAGPWRVVRRSPGRRALIPTYHRLVVTSRQDLPTVSR